MTQPSEQPTRRCQTWGAYSGRRCELQQGHRGGHRLEVITEPLTHEAAAPTRPQLRDRKPNPIIIEPIGTPDPVPSPALALGGSPLDRSLIRAAISNAYYECREAGESMETAADRAAHAVMELAPVATCDHTSTGRRTINGPDGRMAGAETFCVACGLVLRPDPVASPLNGDVLAWHDRLPHQQKGCPICEHGLIGSPDPTHNHDGGDGHCRSSCPLWTEALSRVAASADDIDPVSRPTPPVASPAPLDVERLARALIESDLMPLYREYAMRVPTMDPSETVEHLAAVWAGWVAAAYAAEGQPAADPAVLADQIVDEGRVSAFGPPGTTFTPERQAKGQPVAEEPR